MITYQEGDVETAMCLWEALLEIRHRPDIVPMFEQHGTSAIRTAVIYLVANCEAEWQAAVAKNEQLEPFDWAHCPRFLERNLDRLVS